MLNPAPGGGVSGGVTLTIDNPLPAISKVNPASALAGSGSGFDSGTTATVGGVAASVLFTDENTLVAHAKSGAFHFCRVSQ
jgi:hypothetical protein